MGWVICMVCLLIFQCCQCVVLFCFGLCWIMCGRWFFSNCCRVVGIRFGNVGLCGVMVLMVLIVLGMVMILFVVGEVEEGIEDMEVIVEEVCFYCCQLCNWCLYCLGCIIGGFDFGQLFQLQVKVVSVSDGVVMCIVVGVIENFDVYQSFFQCYIQYGQVGFFGQFVQGGLYQVFVLVQEIVGDGLQFVFWKVFVLYQQYVVCCVDYGIYCCEDWWIRCCSLGCLIFV